MSVEVKMVAQEDKEPTLAMLLEAPETEDEKGAETATETAEAEAGTETAEALANNEEAAKEVEKQIENAEESGLRNDELNELRGMLRELRQENIRLRNDLDTVKNRQETEIGKEPDPTELQRLQGELNQLAERRSESYATLLEAMELNPKYEDVREVCSASNFNDIFDTVARQRSDDKGTSFNEELLAAKLEVWGQTNPYRYMYDVIKQYHPSYKTKAEPEKKVEPKKEEPTPPAKTAKEVLEQRAKTPAKAPGSIAGIAGTATEQGGWTAAKIDSLPENELHKVPREVYNKWLSGDLD